MNIAIIAAAGAGTRMRLGEAKAFLPLGGVPLLIHSLRAMDRTAAVDASFVVAPEQHVRKTKRLIEENGIEKVVRVLAGGRERQDSIFAGLKAAGAWLAQQRRAQQRESPHSASADSQDSAISTQDFVLVHDAARALIEPRDVMRVLRKAQRTGAAILAVRARDTLKQVSRGAIVSTPDRNSIWQAQTPQAFHFDLLYQAHLMAKRKGILATDEAALVERLGKRVAVVKGSETNIKITYPLDLVIAEALLGQRGSSPGAKRSAKEEPS